MLLTRLLLLFLGIGCITHAEKGVLNLFLLDFQNRPLGRRSGVHIGIKAPVISAYPDDNGTVLLAIGPDINPGDTVQLVLLEPETLFMVSPWDSRMVVPSFISRGQSYVNVVLAPKGSLEALQQARVREAIAAQISSSRAPRTIGDDPAAHPPSDVIQEASATGYKPEQLKEALDSWAKQAKSPRSKAIAALWAGDYDSAIRESNAAIRSESAAERSSSDSTLFEMSLFLAQALYQKGNYEQAVAAAQIAGSVHPDDPRVVSALGLYLAKVGKTDTALAYLRSAANLEKQLSNSSLATFNVAEELYRKGEWGAARELYAQVVEEQSGLQKADADLVSRAKARLRSIGGTGAASRPATHTLEVGGVFKWVLRTAGTVAAIAILWLISLNMARLRKVKGPEGFQKYREFRKTEEYLDLRRYQDLRDFSRYEWSSPKLGPPQKARSRLSPWWLVPGFVALLITTLLLLPLSKLTHSTTQPSLARPPRLLRTYEVLVHMADPGGRDLKTVHCWSSLDGRRSQAGTDWTFRFELSPAAGDRSAVFFADDPVGNRSGRVAVALASVHNPSVTMTLVHHREPVFSGTVATAAGEPVANATVNIVGRQADVHTDARGRFAFPPNDVTTKSLLLAVSAPGYTRALVPRVVDQRMLQIALLPRR